MNSIRHYLAAMAVVLVVACGGSPETTQANTAPAPDAAATTAPGTSTTTAQRPDVAPSETSGTATASAEQSERIAIAQTNTPAPEATHQYKEGEYYRVLTTAQGTSGSPGAVEVTEVFWYGCPHCYNFDPYIERWKTELPENVTLTRLPVMWNPTNEIHARIYYTAEALGILDEIHPAVFKAMHLEKKTLTSEPEIEAMFERFGVQPEDFKKTFRSFPVETNLKKAKKLTERYRIQSVPVLVIDGKYVTTGDGIKNFDDMIAVANELIGRELAAR